MQALQGLGGDGRRDQSARGRPGLAVVLHRFPQASTKVSNHLLIQRHGRAHPNLRKDIAPVYQGESRKGTGYGLTCPDPASILRSMRNHDHQTQAGAHILARNWNRVLELGRAWSQADPNDPIARLLLVTGLLLKGDYREAYAQHDRLFKLSDEEEEDTAAQQDPRAALRAFAGQLAGEHLDNPGARLFLGLTLAQIGDLEGAIREYKESARLAPDDPFPHYFHGQALHTLDRLDMAIREYREAVTLAPQDVRMRLNLGSAYYEQGIFESAIAQYREALKLNPDDPYIHYNLGLALADQGRFEPAIASYKESARLNPKDPLVRYALGIVHETKGRVHEAISEFEAAVQLAPTMASAYAKLGWLYYNKNKVPQALENFEKAARYDPDDAQTLHGLGLAKLAAGKKDEGILSLKQAYQKEEREDKKRLIRSVLVKVGALSH